MIGRLLGAYVLGFSPGYAVYHCSGCGCDTTITAVPCDGDGVSGPLDCSCGEVALLRMVVHA